MMSRIVRSTGTALAVLVILGVAGVACGDSGLSTTTDTTSISETAPTSDTSPTSDTAPTSETAPTQTPAPESSSPATNPALRSDGFGAVPFGEPADTALPLLVDALGRQPTEDSTSDAMSQGFGGTTVRFVVVGRILLIFSDGGYYRDDGVLHFAGWSLGPDPGDLATPQGITIGSSVDDLRAAFGDQLRLSTEPSGCTGTWVFGVGPTELGYEGELSGPSTDGSSSVTTLAAGAQPSC